MRHCKKTARILRGRSTGVALMMVLTILSVMMILMADVVYESRVNLQIAQSGYDDLRAEYLAKSSANLALVILRADSILEQVMKKMGGASGDTTDSHNDFWHMFSGKPLTMAMAFMKAMSGDDEDDYDDEDEDDRFDEPSSIDALDSGETGTIFASDFIAALKEMEADIQFDITDEAKKVNLNAMSDKRLRPTVLAVLRKLFQGDVETEYLQDIDMTVEKIHGEMIDWIDKNEEKALHGGYENDAYSDLKPRYNPQNAPFETIEQINMLPSVNRQTYQIIRDYVTVYPRYIKNIGDFRINANTMDTHTLLALFPQLQERLADVHKFFEKKGGGLSGPNFASKKELRRQLETWGVNFSLPDNKSMIKYFTVNSNIFRIVASGEVGDSVKRLTLVVKRPTKEAPPKKETAKKKKGDADKKKPPTNDYSYDDQEEAEETGKKDFPFEILYWKMGN